MRRIALVLLIAFIGLGFTAQLGTKQSQLGNIELGAQSSPFVALVTNIKVSTANVARRLTATTSLLQLTLRTASERMGAIFGQHIIALIFDIEAPPGTLRNLASQINGTAANVAVLLLSGSATVVNISRTINTTAANVIAQLTTAANGTIVKLIFDIEAPPGTLRNLASQIGTRATVAVQFFSRAVTTIALVFDIEAPPGTLRNLASRLSASTASIRASIALNTTVLQRTISTTAENVATVLMAAGNGTMIRLLFDIEAPPGTLRNLASQLSTSASVAVRFSRISTIFLMNSVRTASATIGQRIHPIVVLCEEVCASTVSIVLNVFLNRVSIFRNIVTSQANVATLATLTALMRAIIKAPVQMVQFGLGHLTTIVIAIATSAANLATSIANSTLYALSIRLTAAHVTALQTLIVTRTLIIRLPHGALAIVLRPIGAFAATISTSTASIFFILSAASRLVSASIQIVVSSAKLNVFSFLQFVVSRIITASQSNVVIIINRLIHLAVGIASTVEQVTIAASTIKATIAGTILAARGGLIVLFGRILSLLVTIGASTHLLTAIRHITAALTSTISASRASIIFVLARVIRSTIAALTTIAPVASATLQPVINAISTTRQSLIETLQATVTQYVNVSVINAPVAVIRTLLHRFIATIQTTTASVTLMLTSVRALLTTIASRAQSLATTETAIFATSQSIVASITSLLVTSTRGPFIQAQINILHASIAILKTLRTLLAAIITTSSEPFLVVQQIRFTLMQTINAISELVRMILLGFQPTPPFTKQVIIINPPQPSQVIVAVGVLQ